MTPGQTIGPFFGMALPYEGGELVVPADHPDAVELSGRVLDGAGEPVPDALLEVWSGDGFGRCPTDADGQYRFTVARRPGFLAMAVCARGLPDRLFTRVYLPGALEDTLLASLPEYRQDVMWVIEDGARFLFDIRLQGDDQTVFLRYD